MTLSNYYALVTGEITTNTIDYTIAIPASQLHIGRTDTAPGRGDGMNSVELRRYHAISLDWQQL